MLGALSIVLLTSVKKFFKMAAIFSLSYVIILLVKAMLIKSGSGFVPIVQVKENDFVNLDSVKAGHQWDGSYFACRAFHNDTGLICDWIYPSRNQSARFCREKNLDMYYSAENLFCSLKIKNITLAGEPGSTEPGKKGQQTSTISIRCLFCFKRPSHFKSYSGGIFGSRLYPCSPASDLPG